MDRVAPSCGIRRATALAQFGQGPLWPQQIVPQPPFVVGPLASQWSPAPHAVPDPQWHVPFTQRSPSPQHRIPQAGPAAQPPPGSHAATSASLLASAHPPLHASTLASPQAVLVHASNGFIAHPPSHSTPLFVQTQPQPSLVGTLSPIAYSLPS
jgi:hypothetical protein